MLWEEEQERALGNLRVVLSSLRKALGDNIDIQRDRAGLSPDANIRVDVQELLDVMSSPADRATIDCLKEALDLYQGSFLLGFNLRNASMFENWVTVERQHFRTVFDNKFQALLDCLLNDSQWQEAVSWGENWIARSRQGYAPETAFRALMKAYAGTGDLSGLSSAYQRCIHYMGQELGVDPSEQTQQLYIQLLGGRMPVADVAAAPVISPGVSVAQVVLNRWRDSKAEFLDMAGLSLVYASLGELELSMEDTGLLMRSALHHGLDVRSWVGQIGAPEHVVPALVGCLASEEQPYTRIQIIDALKEITGVPAGRVLVDMAMHDRSAEVRTEAALAAMVRGEGKALIDLLAEELREQGDTAVIPPLVALMDETGSMPKLDLYPRLMVWMGVMQRRWGKHRDAVRSMVLRSLIYSSVFSYLYGCTRPFLVFLANAGAYYRTLDQMSINSLSWVFSGGVGSLMIGGVQGSITGFAVGLTDALSSLQNREKWRILAAGLSGEVQSFTVLLASMAEFTSQIAKIEITISVLILHGFIYGVGLSFMYPPLGKWRSYRQQFSRALWVTASLLVVRTLQVFLIWGTKKPEVLLTELIFVIAVVFSIALAFGKKSVSNI